jgi:hypothetical protein
MRFAAVIGQTGRVFLGVSGMNKTNGTGVIKEFWPTGSGGGVADSFDIWAEDSTAFAAAIGLLHRCQQRGRGTDRRLLDLRWGTGPPLRRW